MWAGIRHDVSKFCSLFGAAVKLDESGKNDEDRIHDCLEAFKQKSSWNRSGDEFMYLECWRYLKDKPKWALVDSARTGGKKPTKRRREAAIQLDADTFEAVWGNDASEENNDEVSGANPSQVDPPLKREEVRRIASQRLPTDHCFHDQTSRPIGSKEAKKTELEDRRGAHMAKAHIRLALALEEKIKILAEHSRELKRQGDLENMRFMFDCFSKDLNTMPEEARQFLSLKRQSFLEDMRSELAVKQANRVAMELAAAKDAASQQESGILSEHLPRERFMPELAMPEDNDHLIIDDSRNGS
jgi:hypothetical protein